MSYQDRVRIPAKTTPTFGRLVLGLHHPSPHAHPLTHRMPTIAGMSLQARRQLLESIVRSDPKVFDGVEPTLLSSAAQALSTAKVAAARSAPRRRGDEEVSTCCFGGK